MFRRTAEKKPTAAVFVDFEHWYISLTKIHNKKPNVKGFTRMLSRKYDIKDITFFGDFSNPSLASEILKIRAVTNNIIQTSNTGNYKKDFTDFIMLDRIYQTAMFSPDIDAFIIFSGDGHFSSVVSCIKNNCGKEVGVFGVSEAFSYQLKETASWYKEVPTEFDLNEKVFDMIFTNLKDVDKSGKSSRPSFIKTVKHVSSLYGVSEDSVKKALDVLIDNGYLKKKEERVENRKVIFLDFDWEKIEADEIWVKDPNLKKVSEEKKQIPEILHKNNSRSDGKEIKKTVVLSQKKEPIKQKTVKKPSEKKKSEVKTVEKEIQKPQQAEKITKQKPVKKATLQKKPTVKKAPPKNTEQKPKTNPTAQKPVKPTEKPEEKPITTPVETKAAAPVKKKKRRRYYPPKQKTNNIKGEK